MTWKEIRLCPKWKGCTTVAIKDHNFSSNFTSEDDNNNVRPAPGDIVVDFKENIQRLHVTIYASDRVTSAKIYDCKVLSKENDECQCPQKVFFLGKKHNMAWTFDLDGKEFKNNCNYSIKMSVYDECFKNILLPWQAFSVSYSSALKNEPLTGEMIFATTVLALLALLVTVFIIIFIKFVRCRNYQKPYTIPIPTFDSIDTPSNLLLLYELDVHNQAQQLLRDLKKALKVPPKGNSQTNKDKKDRFPDEAGIASKFQVNDLHNTDETNILDPLSWVYRQLDPDNTCKVIIISSVQAKATELYITQLERQKITHSNENLLEQLRGQEQKLSSDVNTGGSKGITSKNVGRFSCKSTSEPVTKSVDGLCDKSSDTIAVVDETKMELLGKHKGDITEELMDKRMSLDRPTSFLFRKALQFIINQNIGFNYSKFFQIRLSGGDPHVLQYVTPSRVFTWPDYRSEFLQAIQNKGPYKIPQ
ncbi:uncharacterized protein LOC143026520 isoform X2 [Oratosquilla oratoria]|uniref:uncharacterized protein LOC143026520 isoform X2 n=1 Tax=Oratosquilla oratoria TaxID=337810 RepID=UPI003F75F633